MSVSRTFQNLPPHKQQRVLDEALSEFARQGYARASLNTLVRRLGIAKGSIFQYFRDKAGLFRTVFHFAVERVIHHLRGVRQATQGQDPFARLHQSLVAGLELIERDPRLFELYLRIMFEGDIPFRAELLGTVLNFGRDYILDILREGVADGHLDPELDLEVAAFVVEAVLERFLVARAVEHMDLGLGVHGVPRARAEERAARVVELLRRGLGCLT